MSKLVFGGETLITATELDAKGYQDSSAVAGAIATAVDGLATDASVASAIETAVNGLATDASVEAAIASATAGFQTAADVSAAINGAGFLTEVSVGSFATPASDPSFAKKVDFDFYDPAQSSGHTVNGKSVYVCAEANYWDTPYGDYTAVKFKAYYSPEEGPQSAYYIGYTSGDEMDPTFVPLVTFAAHSGGTADITVPMDGWNQEYYRQKATINTAEGVQIVWPELTAADYDSENSRLNASKNWAYIIFPYKNYKVLIEGEEAWDAAPNAPYFLQMGNGKVEAYFDFTPGQAAGNALDSRITEVVNGMDLDVDTTAIDASISALDASIVAINNAGYLVAQNITKAEYDQLQEKDPHTIYITDETISLVEQTAFDASVAAIDASINAINNAGYQTAADVSTAIGTAMSSALHMVTLTQEQYDALQEKAANTLYIISE